MLQTPLSGMSRVQKGELLLSVNFNIVTDRLLHTLSQEVGATFKNRTVRAMAFAEDLLILDSAVGLQHLIKVTHGRSFWLSLEDCRRYERHLQHQ